MAGLSEKGRCLNQTVEELTLCSGHTLYPIVLIILKVLVLGLLPLKKGQITVCFDIRRRKNEQECILSRVFIRVTLSFFYIFSALR